MTRNQIAMLVTLAAVWGASFLFMRIAAPVLGPVWLIELRVLIAGLVLLPVLMFRGQLSTLRSHWRQLLLAGTLNAALPFTLLAYSATEVTAGFNSILNATVPIFSALFAFLVIKEQLSPAKVIGIVLGFFGVVTLVGWQGSGQDAVPLLAVAAGLTAAIFYVLAANYTKWRMAAMPPLVYVAGSQLGAALVLLPVTPWFVPQHNPGITVIMSVMGLAVLSTAFAFSLYYRLLQQIGATQTLTVTYLIPLFAIVWGYWLLDETVTLQILLGCGMILSGTALANGLGQRRA